MSNDNIPSTLVFTAEKFGTRGDRRVRLKSFVAYKVLEVKTNTKYNDYGYENFRSLVIQRDGGVPVTIAWDRDAVQC